MYSEILTKEARMIATRDQSLKNLTLAMKEDELYFVGQHIYLNVQVFINPMVSQLSNSFTNLRPLCLLCHFSSCALHITSSRWHLCQSTLTYSQR